jgi:exopolyphosphatase/guanosine-5'-triphosphate,3'-diphosphate pyrophosphatase
MRLAILDLGTNTFHLLITDVHPDKTYSTVFRTKAVVKLGQGGFGKKRIADLQFAKAVKTIRHFKNLADQYKVDRIFGFATSAIRSSSNGKDLVAKIYKETGIKIEIISGDEEAELIYLGVSQCIILENEYTYNGHRRGQHGIHHC